MGHSISLSIPRLTATIHTSNGARFRLFYQDLVDHIVLLRQVSIDPEMLNLGDKLDFYVKEYCHQMSNNQLMSKNQQSKVSWQIEWIWHVHRLHPIAYYNDCINQVPGRYFIDKKVRKLNINQYEKMIHCSLEKSILNQRIFVPSIDLTKAVLCQHNFLEKFQNHKLYLYDLRRMDMTWFEQMIENYISFMKLARKNTIIVPTFDIDIIWHTHMRYPMHYREFSSTLCGFVLDHDDSMTPEILKDAYQNTAERWKNAYQSEYGQNGCRSYLQEHFNLSHCAMIYKPNKYKQTNNQNSMGCGGWFEFGNKNSNEDADGGSCDSSCGGGCGGD